MRHDSGKFRFVVRFEYQAFVHIEIAARKGEGIDLVGIDNLDVERDLGVGVFDDILADAVDVFAYNGVFHKARRLLEFGCDLGAQFYFLLQGYEIGENFENPPGNITIPDILHVAVLPECKTGCDEQACNHA